MDYSPWSEREIWLFLKVAVSPKPKRSHPPKLVCMHDIIIVASIEPILIDYAMVRKGKFFELKPKRSFQNWCACMTSIYSCMNFLMTMTMDYSPWSEREIWPFLKVAVSPKPKRSHPPKLVCMHLTSIYSCMNFLSRFRSIEIF